MLTCNDAFAYTLHYLRGLVQGRRHGFEGGGTISRAERAKKFLPPTFCLPGGHETEQCTCFIIVIITSKRLPAPNEIT